MNGIELKAARVPGTTMNDWAKMMGMTPAELTRRGIKLFCPSRIRPRPTTFRGICTGIFRAAMVMATTAAVIPIQTAIRAMTSTTPISPTFMASHVRATAAGNPWMIEKKIIRDIPFPMPRSRDLLTQPHHEYTSDREDDHGRHDEAEARVEDSTAQALKERCVGVGLDDAEDNRGVAGPLGQLLTPFLTLLLQLLHRREDGREKLEHDGRRRYRA